MLSRLLYEIAFVKEIQDQISHLYLQVYFHKIIFIVFVNFSALAIN